MTTIDANGAHHGRSGQYETKPQGEYDGVLPDGVTTLAVDQWVVDEDAGIRVSFTDIGEGWNGDFDEDDPDDAALLRIDVQLRGTHPHASLDDDADEDENGVWYWAQGDSSLCTNVERDRVTPQQLRRLADLAMADLKETSVNGWSVSGRVKSFESLTIADAGRNQPVTPPHTTEA